MTMLTTKLSARQFIHLEDPPGARLELVDGEITVSPSPSFGHSYVDTILRAWILGYIQKHDLGVVVGDVDTIMGEEDVCRPDIIFIAKQRTGKVFGKRAIEIAPDLCVEIISPSSRDDDRTRKLQLYAQRGVAHYWIVDPEERTIEAYKLSRGKYQPCGAGRGEQIVRLPPFEGLAISLKRLWPPQ